MEAINGISAFGGIGSQPQLKQNDGGEESHDGSMTTQNPFWMLASSEEVNEDIRIK
jgi:hypothetical protein